MREKAARAIANTRHYSLSGSDISDQSLAYADAVIAAIEPDIRADERRKVFEALAEEWRSAAKGETSRGRIDAFHEFAFTMELRARKEAAGEDDTTTAFVASLTPHQRDYVRSRIDATSGSID